MNARAMTCKACGADIWTDDRRLLYNKMCFYCLDDLRFANGYDEKKKYPRCPEDPNTGGCSCGYCDEEEQS